MNKFKIMKCTWGLPHMGIEKGDIVLFLGELNGMDGHCVIATKSGKIIWGIHSERFFEVPEEEM